MVGIVVDQLRYDYLTRFHPQLGGGFARFLDHGAVFTNARYEQYPPVTAAGHAAFLTGAPPALSGIIAKGWYDRVSQSVTEGVSDDAVRLVGGAPRACASPKRLMVSTLGDEMKMAWRGKPRVIGISMKDRGAVLPAGHMADAAYWFDFDSGNMLSSTYFLSELATWVRDFNARRVCDRFLGTTWSAHRVSPDYPPIQLRVPTTSGRAYLEALWASPFGNDLLEQFAELTIARDDLGHYAVTDLLTVSFSSNDLVGHRTGPDSAESRDMALRTDLVIGRLLSFLDRHVGLDQVLAVLTADHGVAQSRGVLQNDRLPGHATALGVASSAIELVLHTRYWRSGWLLNPGESSPYLNLDLISELHLDPGDVERTAALAPAGWTMSTACTPASRFCAGALTMPLGAGLITFISRRARPTSCRWRRRTAIPTRMDPRTITIPTCR